VARLLLAIVCAAGCGFGQAVEKVAQPYYKRLIDRGMVSGASFAEVARGEVVGTGVFGNARPDSMWRAASTSKALTAVGLMRLVERGQLDLDVDVNQYLMTLKVPATKTKPITLRHLLTHTAGLDDPFVGSGFLAATGAQRPLASVMRDWLPVRLYEPGEVRLYSNFGYGLVGAVLEDITGKRYEDFMRSEVLEPLGMNNSTFEQPLSKEAEQQIVPAMERSALGFTRPADIIYHRATAGGGLTTTLADLLCFVRFVQRGGSITGRQVLRAETLGQMLGGDGSESYGFASGINRGERYWYAGGDLGGYHTVLLWFPEHDRALVTMAASASTVATWNLVPEVMQSWFGDEKKAAGVAVEAIAKANQYAERVAGTYRPVRYPHHDLGKTFLATMDQRVRANGDGSIGYEGERWIAVAPLRFRNESDERQLNFQEDARGRIRFLNQENERIRWYESGRAAIVFYFGFVVAAVILFWRNRRGDGVRSVRWMAAAIAIHSLGWLGAVLAADPQRLILGKPWYLQVALLFGALVPVVWVYLAGTTCWALVKKRDAGWDVLITLGLGLYIPFILYWQLTA